MAKEMQRAVRLGHRNRLVDSSTQRQCKDYSSTSPAVTR